MGSSGEERKNHDATPLRWAEPAEEPEPALYTESSR